MTLETIRDTILTLNNTDIFEQTRRREVIEMRCVANQYMSKIKQMRLSEIVRDYKRCGFKTHHATILHSLKNYKHNCYYNPDLELVMKSLIDDSKLYVMRQIPKATNEQLQLIEEILMN
tara:strand:+ start:288 stop:644 length:357 start_codon:yes stop_codon:yes gene_type:complete